MYKIVDELGAAYTQYKYVKEADFEKMIVANACLLYTSGLWQNSTKPRGEC